MHGGLEADGGRHGKQRHFLPGTEFEHGEAWGSEQAREQVVDDDVLASVDVLGRVARFGPRNAFAPPLDAVAARAR